MIHSQPEASSLALRIGQRRTGFTLPGSVRRVLPGGPLASPSICFTAPVIAGLTNREDNRSGIACRSKLKAAQTRRVTP